MICDLCSKNEATVHLTEVINDQTRELHLCEACAREKGAEATEQLSAKGEGGPEKFLGGGLAELLAGLTDLSSKLPEGAVTAGTVCPQCGMTYEDFRKTGRLGCGSCYETFRRFLAPLLRRIHGSTEYLGRFPPTTKRRDVDVKEELSQLKEQLKAAVAAESFEEAARLRDRVRALEGKMKRESGGKPRNDQGRNRI